MREGGIERGKEGRKKGTVDGKSLTKGSEWWGERKQRGVSGRVNSGGSETGKQDTVERTREEGRRTKRRERVRKGTKERGREWTTEGERKGGTKEGSEGESEPPI